MAQYLIRNAAGQVRGPVTGTELRRLIRGGQVKGADELRPAEHSDAKWRSVSSVGDLAKDLVAAEVSASKARISQDLNATEAVRHIESQPGPQDSIDPGMFDKILRVGFAIGRTASVVVILGSLFAVVVCAALFVLNSIGPTPTPAPVASIVPPSFADFATNCKAINTQKSSYATGAPARSWTTKRADPCAQWRDRISRTCELLGIGGMEDALCSTTMGFPSDYRDLFTAGILSHAETFYTTNPKPANCDGAMAAEWYIENFERLVKEREQSLVAAQEEARSAQAQRATIRNTSLTAAGLSIASLIVFLVLPLLIQIERNTRTTKRAH